MLGRANKNSVCWFERMKVLFGGTLSFGGMLSKDLRASRSIFITQKLGVLVRVNKNIVRGTLSFGGMLSKELRASRSIFMT